MANRLHVGTRKGLFELARGKDTWEIVDTQFLGDPVSAVLADADGSVWAALDLGHFGAKLWRRDRDGSWRELAVPTFPPKLEDAGDDPHPWSLGKIWVLESGGAPGRLWAGTMPGGLFRSDDDGASWLLNEALWHMPERRQWAGVAGGEQPGINSVLIDPRNPYDIRIGVSTAGVWASTDTGARGGSSIAACMPNTCRRSSVIIRSSRTSTGWRAAPLIPRSCGASITTVSSARKTPGRHGAK
jgi:hypothetical protein